MPPPPRRAACAPAGAPGAPRPRAAAAAAPSPPSAGSRGSGAACRDARCPSRASPSSSRPRCGRSGSCQPPNPAAQDVPVQMEDRLPEAGDHVDDDLVVLESGAARRLGDEVEHPATLVGRKLAYFAERLDVPLRDDEQVRVRLRIKVAN